MNAYEQIREALVTIRALATCGGTDFGNPAIRGLLDQMDTIRATAQSALAIPPRNCDVGTPKEQADKLLANFDSISLIGERPVDAIQKWNQMPYKKGNAK